MGPCERIMNDSVSYRRSASHEIMWKWLREDVGALSCGREVTLHPIRQSILERKRLFAIKWKQDNADKAACITGLDVRHQSVCFGGSVWCLITTKAECWDMISYSTSILAIFIFDYIPQGQQGQLSPRDKHLFFSVYGNLSKIFI